jgi:hypothetical protein
MRKRALIRFEIGSGVISTKAQVAYGMFSIPLDIIASSYDVIDAGVSTFLYYLTRVSGEIV